MINAAHCNYMKTSKKYPGIKALPGYTIENKILSFMQIFYLAVVIMIFRNSIGP
jgi:hypothetical protein